MVAPTYFLAARIMDDAGFAGRLRGVPEDDEGIDLAFLERELYAAEENALRAGNIEPVLQVPLNLGRGYCVIRCWILD
jgi:DNA-binding transcriptional MocR family regulator